MLTNQGGNPLAYLVRQMWKYSEGNKKRVVLFWGLCVIAISLDLFLQPLIWAKIIDTVSKEGIQEGNIQTLLTLLFATVIVELASWSFHGPSRVMEIFNAFQVRVNYRKYLLRGIMNLPLEWHVDHHSGDTIDKVGRGATALYSFSEQTFQVVYAIVRLIGSYAVLVYFSPSSGGIVLVMILITMWITMRFDRIIVKQYEELNKKENEIAESIFDAISNIATVITLRVEQLVFRAIMHKIEKPYELYKKNAVINEVKWFLTSMCCATMVALVLATYFLQNVGAKVETLTASVYLLISYLGKISDIFYTFTTMYGEILKKRANVRNSEVVAHDFTNEDTVDHVLPHNWKEITVSGLSFSYHDNGDKGLHLDDVSLRIGRGKRIALIGKTGSGKSTFLKIARGLYTPSHVSLLVDGIAVTSGFSGIEQDITLIPQSPEIFATTVRENITLGAEYHGALLSRYIDMACFTDVVNGLPKGLETSTKEKGVNLSGGQQQRLALARGLLASDGKDIVLLDEPTSSLDPSTERIVYKNIFDGMKGKTILSTLHRLHLLPLFDRIYLFEDGKVIASGSLDELLTESEEFRQLWQKSLAAVE